MEEIKPQQPRDYLSIGQQVQEFIVYDLRVSGEHQVINLEKYKDDILSYELEISGK